MKIGVSSYSFSRLVRSGAMREAEIPQKAKEMGFDVVEFSTLSPPSGVLLEVHADRLREACEAAGLPVANYTIGADFLNGSNGELAAEIERVRREVDIARRLGAVGMRHDASRGFAAEHRGPKSFEAALPRLAEGCRGVAEYAAGFGIRTMVENHGYFCQDSERVEKLACAVAHPNFGLLIDMGNFICVDENPAVAVGRLMPYAFHCHAKDFHLKSGMQPFPGDGWNVSRGGGYWRGAIIGHGDVPIRQCLRVMRRAGYDGVLSIEFEGMEEPLQGIALGQKNLRRFLAEVDA